MKAYFVFLIFLLASFNLTAQLRPDALKDDQQAPHYIQLMHKEVPNVFEVERAYKLYYANLPFTKNTYSQYYKRWMLWARKFMDNQGYVRELSADEWNREEILIRELHTSNKHQIRNAAEWSFLGPARTYHTDGLTKVTWQTNIYSLDISKSDPNVLYAGGESGGLWKTTDKGINWTLTTKEVLHSSFDAIVIHPSNHDTAFASTSGKIIKTVNGGQSWSTVYSESGLNIYDFEIHRNKPQIIFAAGNKGLLQSIDGGKTWNKQWTELCWTIKSNTEIASEFYCIRQKGNSSEFMNTKNSGTNWNSNAFNWYTPATGNSVTGAILAICQTNALKLYAYLCGQGGSLNGYIGVFISDDGGLTWNNTNPGNAIGGTYSIPNHTNLMAHNGTDGFDQGFYDMAIIVNPKNEDQLIAGGTSWFKSNDGGKTWNALGSYVGGLPWSHPDIQCLEANGNDLWIGSDGGLNYSNNFAISMEARMDGISGADLWGFDSGWNEDILVGGRYHNGNMAWHENFPSQTFFRMGGAESPTGYVNPGPGRKTYFSDIGGYALNGSFNSGVRYFPIGLFPNESYAYYANSQMSWHPNCWNIVYLGYENKIWKSEDGGGTYNLLYAFPGNADNKVYEIEISRSHPEVMYCSQWDGTDDSMWKSENGGSSWKKLTSLPLPNNNDRVKMSLSAEDPNVLWVAVTYGSNGKKIYKTIDGGVSWINLTTAVLNDVRISDILHAYGTDGGIYLGTHRGVFYRNNVMSDWFPYSKGLPFSAETNRLKPFYKEGKLRNGCWGFGVWEIDLFESSRTLPKIMADKLRSACLRDTFYFDDYSVLHHTNAQWTWNFEDVAYQSGMDTRTPKVVFKSPGLKKIKMQIDNPSGVFTDSLYVEVGSACEKDSLPGYALALDGIAAHAQIPALDVSTNNISFMAWVKSTSVQKNWAGILFSRDNSQAAGLSVLSNGELRYHWNSGGYNWSSQARIDQNEWTHVAMVVEPGSVTLYKNGTPYRHVTTVNEHTFVSPFAIGADLNGTDRYFKGFIDEVCFYDRALSQSEIREIMHLTRTHTQESGLKRYYQFNETEGQVLDRQGVSHVSLNASAQRVISTVPVGPGSSQRMDIRARGTYTFDKTGVEITTEDGGVFPNGELCLSRINYIPENNFDPNGNPTSPSYWILHNYGAQKSFSSFKSMKFDSIGFISNASPISDYALYKRNPNADTASWNFSSQASSIFPSTNGNVVFEPSRIQEEGQFLLTKSAHDTVIVSTTQKGSPSKEYFIMIYPNPSLGNQKCTLHSNIAQPVRFKLLDNNGRVLIRKTFSGHSEFELTDLQVGSYHCIFETDQKLSFLKLMVTK